MTHPEFGVPFSELGDPGFDLGNTFALKPTGGLCWKGEWFQGIDPETKHRQLFEALCDQCAKVVRSHEQLIDHMKTQKADVRVVFLELVEELCVHGG